MAEPTAVTERARAATEAPVLVASGLAKSYGATRAIEDVSITVAAGRVVGLLGANGAGKTTTINCVADLLVPDAGSVSVCGLRAADDRYRAGQLFGLAAQDVALYPELSARANLRFFGRLAGMGRADVDRSIAHLAGSLRLEPLLDTTVRALSAGQKRLIHVAASLVHRPRLVLLDEPSAGLDVTARYDLLDVIRWVAAAGAGVLLSSHQLGEVEQVCDDVVILHRGRVLVAGPLEELVAAHREPIVELRAGGEVRRVPGASVAKVLAQLPDVDALESVAVVRPSLESVFLRLTGLKIGEGGEAR